ncbi:MAG: bactofilin family protein [bacterium]
MDGEFSGAIRSDSTISVGKGGVLKSELKARKLVVAGQFLGTAECDSIELVAGGRVEGKLITSSLAIEKGGIFRGESACTQTGDVTVIDFAAESNPMTDTLAVAAD